MLLLFDLYSLADFYIGPKHFLNLSKNCPPHIKRVATTACKIWMFKITTEVNLFFCNSFSMKEEPVGCKRLLCKVGFNRHSLQLLLDYFAIQHGHRVFILFVRKHTHTHPFNGPLSGTTQVSRYQKGKNQSGFYWSKRQWVAVASAGPYASLHLAPDR